MSNRLSRQLSPYLLQHAENPVDWHPWGEEALAIARCGQKPIFLSIGYASCHWCHVMAHETFEDVEIARELNEHFVNIKVDREERPDLDQIYIEAVQIMTGRAGWPLSVFLTPQGEPFFGGAYWPPRARDGMTGFDGVLAAVADAWQHRRPDVLAHARRVTQLLQEIASTPVGDASEAQVVGDGRGSPLGEDKAALSDAAQAAETLLCQSFDPQWGGFGPAPKFPQPLALRWLLRRWRQTGNDELLTIVTVTLDRMAAGGMYDHLGGGFHRYCVDERWLLPHFEKMLYDNAMLAVVYLEAWQATGNQDYAAVVRQTLDYLLRDMTDPQGGFYSSEDADSEGHEGKFYLWTPAEIESVLGMDAGRLFCSVYDVTEAGDIDGRSILKRIRPLAVEAKLRDCDPTPLAERLHAARRELLTARAKRIRPGRDEKVLVAWNSLAIEALALAGKAFGEPRYTTAANSATDFLWQRLRRDDGRLFHYCRNGTAACDAYLDDYAALGNALVTLHETTGSSLRLDQAFELAEMIATQFADTARGGFFYTHANHEALIVRKKDWADNPVPSGNGLAAEMLLRLSAFAGGDAYRIAAEAAINACAAWMQRMPTAVFQLLLATDLCG
jgi:uncharacterized protein